MSFALLSPGHQPSNPGGGTPALPVLPLLNIPRISEALRTRLKSWTSSRRPLRKSDSPKLDVTPPKLNGVVGRREEDAATAPLTYNVALTQHLCHQGQ